MIPETDRVDAARLQTLFVRLLFCDVTFDSYRHDPLRVATAFGLGTDALALLPDGDMPQLLAERHGRKMGVVGEIRKVFVRSYPLIEALPEYRLEDFLCDDVFFDAGAGLPHPYGVGPGYENASKFFFWARNTLRLSGSPARLSAALALKGDFSAYLIDQYQRGSHDYYRRFQHGIYWHEAAAGKVPIILMTAERHMFRITDTARYRTASETGAIDLDLLQPETAGDPNRFV